MKLIENSKRGILFIVSSPSGTGKTTLVQKITEEFEEQIVRSITCTTRQPREEEIGGKDYYFLSREEFEEKKKRGEFLESASVFEHQYGTLRVNIEEKLQEGKHVILVIDTQGAAQVKKILPDAVLIFISPPSMEELKSRLKKRKTETEASLEKRLLRAREEMKEIVNYDYHVINDVLSDAYQVFKSIFIAEAHKIRKENDDQK